MVGMWNMRSMGGMGLVNDFLSATFQTALKKNQGAGGALYNAPQDWRTPVWH